MDRTTKQARAELPLLPGLVDGLLVCGGFLLYSLREVKKRPLLHAVVSGKLSAAILRTTR
jgi:hypothetical protein